jgi:O-antigen ligase
MSIGNEKSLVSKILSWGALATLLIVTPWSTLDPINVPKYTTLAITGGVVLILLIRNFMQIANKENKALLAISGLFLLFLLAAFFVSPIDKATQLFGVNGRNTGLITYVSLLVLFVAAATLTKKGFEKRITFTLIIGGALSVIYGLVQAFNLDPASWVNPYSPVIGFLGNPDFQSSFIGIAAVAVCAIALTPGSSQLNRSVALIYIAVSLFVISKSDAQQGYLVLIAGASSVVGIYLYQSKVKRFTSGYLILLLIGFFTIALGSVNKGPLASILHKDSVIYRGDYWRAGWKITVEHPFFGVGIDSFGDYFLKYRDLIAVNHTFAEYADSAHNYFLDFAGANSFRSINICSWWKYRGGTSIWYSGQPHSNNCIHIGRFWCWSCWRA